MPFNDIDLDIHLAHPDRRRPGVAPSRPEVARMEAARRAEAASSAQEVGQALPRDGRAARGARWPGLWRLRGAG